MASLEKRGATVDIDRLTGDRAGLAGAKKQSGSRDFVRGLTATLQHRVEKSLKLFLGTHIEFFRQRGPKIFGHLRLGYWTGTKRIHTHTFAGSLRGGHARQPEHARLSRCVCRAPRECRLCGET